MATAGTILRMNFGSVDAIKVAFTSISDGDTFVSGVANVVGHLFMQTNNPVTQQAVGIAVSESAGTFTFRPGEEAVGEGDLYIFSGTAT